MRILTKERPFDDLKNFETSLKYNLKNSYKRAKLMKRGKVKGIELYN